MPTIVQRIVGAIQTSEGIYTGGAVVNQSGSPILSASDTDHQKKAIYAQSGTMAAATLPLTEIRGAGATIRSVRAGSIAVCTGNAAATIDVKKNGTTVLSAPIVLDSSNTVYIGEGGTVSVSSAVAGDVLTAVITVDAGTGALGSGMFVEVLYDEDYA